MLKQAFYMDQILYQLQKHEIDMDAKNDDMIIEVKQNAFSTKQVIRKFKYISHQSLYIISAMLLTLEQFMFNDHNPNKRRHLQSPDLKESISKIYMRESEPKPRDRRASTATDRNQALYRAS